MEVHICSSNMKVALILCLVLVGTQASFLDDLKSTFSGLGQAFTDTFHQVGEQAKVVGGKLLEQAKTQGGQLASQALQSLLLGTMNALQPSSTSATKRDLTSLFSQFGLLQHTAESFLHDKTEALQHTFQAAVGKLQELAHTSPDNVIHQVDSVVQAHHALAETLKHDLVQGLSNMFHQAFQHQNTKRNLFSDKVAETLHHLQVNFGAVFSHHFGELDKIVHQLGEALIAHSLPDQD